MRPGIVSVTAFMATVASVLIITSAQAEMRITDDMGGLMTQYASRFASVRASGEKVVIDGPCYSACTMLLGMLPRGQVCVTPNAVLGFHAAWNFDESGRRVTSSEATRALLDIYPARVRGWIARRGGLSPNLKLMRGRELAAMYPMCNGATRAQAARPARSRGGRPLRNVAIPASARSASAR